jgi:hypothetical protein
MLDRDGRPPFRDTVERFDLVEPFALDYLLLEIETRRRGIACGSAAMARLDRHEAVLEKEHNRNNRRPTFRPP